MKTIVRNSAGIIPGMVFFLAMIPTVIVRKVIVVAKLPKRVDNLIIHVYAIIEAMTNNAWFPNASSLLADVKTKNDNLQAAENLAKTREIGKAKARDVEKYIVINAVSNLVAYVQNICNLNPGETAVAIAESALFHAKGKGGMPKRLFSAKSIMPGTVSLTGNVGYPCFAHEWIMSRTPGDQASWYITIIPSTKKAKTLVAGLRSGERVYFRHRFMTRKGFSDWAQMISVIVS